MSPIAETARWTIGRFIVQARPRQDNPAFCVYLVFLGGRLIGKSFSLPDLGCCLWLQRTGGCYAESSAEPLNYRDRQKKRRPGRGARDIIPGTA